MRSLAHISLLALAGALGTLARYGLVLFFGRLVSWKFPVGTLVVNVIGCLAFGLVWALATERAKLSIEMRMVILVGFLGGFTTFSSFAFEAQNLVREVSLAAALGYVAASNILGIGAVLAGLHVGKMF